MPCSSLHSVSLRKVKHKRWKVVIFEFTISIIPLRSNAETLVKTRFLCFGQSVHHMPSKCILAPKPGIPAVEWDGEAARISPPLPSPLASPLPASPSPSVREPRERGAILAGIGKGQGGLPYRLATSTAAAAAAAATDRHQPTVTPRGDT